MITVNAVDVLAFSKTLVSGNNQGPFLYNMFFVHYVSLLDDLDGPAYRHDPVEQAEREATQHALFSWLRPTVNNDQCDWEIEVLLDFSSTSNARTLIWNDQALMSAFDHFYPEPRRRTDEEFRKAAQKARLTPGPLSNHPKSMHIDTRTVPRIPWKSLSATTSDIEDVLPHDLIEAYPASRVLGSAVGDVVAKLERLEQHYLRYAYRREWVPLNNICRLRAQVDLDNAEQTFTSVPPAEHFLHEVNARNLW